MTQGLGLHRSARIEVAASVDAVWGVLTDLPGWPTWMPGVKAVEADGPLGPGTRFRWRTTSGVIRSEVLEVQPGHSVVWRGRTLGIEALHSWRLEDLGGAGTLVETEETWTGLLPRLLPGAMGRSLARALDRTLAALKSESERRAGTAS